MRKTCACPFLIGPSFHLDQQRLSSSCARETRLSGFQCISRPEAEAFSEDSVLPSGV
jgi:hypothetical protein